MKGSSSLGFHTPGDGVVTETKSVYVDADDYMKIVLLTHFTCNYASFEFADFVSPFQF